MLFTIQYSNTQLSLSDLDESHITSACMDLHSKGHIEIGKKDSMDLNRKILDLKKDTSITSNQFTFTRQSTRINTPPFNHSQALTDVMNKYRAFFAFSTEQFNSKAIKCIQYTSLPTGLICPAIYANSLVKAIADLSDKHRSEKLIIDTKEEIILESLINHECFYTSEWDDCIDDLEHYPITNDEIKTCYLKYCSQYQ